MSMAQQTADLFQEVWDRGPGDGCYEHSHDAFAMITIHREKFQVKEITQATKEQELDGPTVRVVFEDDSIAYFVEHGGGISVA